MAIEARLAGLGYSAIDDASKKHSSDFDTFPHPLRKQLARCNDCSRVPVYTVPLQAVHLHGRSATDAGASKMLTVRDRLRRDVVAADQYNSLKIAAAKGELSQSCFQYSRNAFFFAAEGDKMGTVTAVLNTSGQGSGSCVVDDNFKDQKLESGPL